MDQAAITKAEIRLHAMERAYGDLTAVCSELEFSSDWYVFVFSMNGVYEVLKGGAEATEASRLWMREMIARDDADPLLKYLFEARNDEEHGLARSVKYKQASGGLAISASAGDGMLEFTIRRNEDETVTITPVNSTFPEGQYWIEETWAMSLVPVTARSGKVFDPPTEHKGTSIETGMPLEAARLALDHMRHLVAEAKQLAAP